ncbi:MAG TPA: nitroreductase family protein [Clostridia bacterium]|nr:nitroreductase family protein [Clostridia bacterium]
MFKRRSIRRYRDMPVTEEQLEEILRAAMAAPSAGNQQPWHFIVINDRSILKEIPKFHPYANMLNEAPCAIVVCGDTSRERHKSYWVQDCSAATQNMLLMAAEMGLGFVWLGVYLREERVSELRKLLDIPDNIIPLNIVAIGHPAEEKGPSDRFDETRIHKNKWR